MRRSIVSTCTAWRIRQGDISQLRGGQRLTSRGAELIIQGRSGLLWRRLAHLQPNYDVPCSALRLRAENNDSPCITTRVLFTFGNYDFLHSPLSMNHRLAAFTTLRDIGHRRHPPFLSCRRFAGDRHQFRNLALSEGVKLVVDLEEPSHEDSRAARRGT